MVFEDPARVPLRIATCTWFIELMVIILDEAESVMVMVSPSVYPAPVKSPMSWSRAVLRSPIITSSFSAYPEPVPVIVMEVKAVAPLAITVTMAPAPLPPFESDGRTDNPVVVATTKLVVVVLSIAIVVPPAVPLSWVACNAVRVKVIVPGVVSLAIAMDLMVELLAPDMTTFALATMVGVPPTDTTTSSPDVVSATNAASTVAV